MSTPIDGHSRERGWNCLAAFYRTNQARFAGPRSHVWDISTRSRPVTPPTAIGARRLHRDSVIKLASRLPACVMAMAACCGAHHLGRLLQACGHEIRLISPEYVQPYVEAQKNMA